MAVGYVYVMSNAMMPGLLKIGYTCSSVEKRRRELSGATGVPHEFTVEFFQLTDDVEEIESLVHAELSPYRITDGREFFSAKLAEVVAAIGRHAKEPTLRFERPEVQAVTTINSRFCRRCGARYERTAAKALCPKCGF